MGKNNSEGRMSNVIDEFSKNSGGQEKYIISLNHFQGNDYMDIRLFYKPDDKEDFLPTRKGISLSVEHIGRLMDAIKKAKNTVEKQ